MKRTKKSAKKPVDTGISAWYNDSARGKNPELIFVRVHRDTVSFLTMHTWLFLYAAMIQDIITISKINLRGKCFFSPAKKVSILPLSRNSLSEPYGIMVSGAFKRKMC